MCAEVQSNKIRCGRYKVEMPPATDRRYVECVRLAQRQIEEHKPYVKLRELKDRYQGLVFKCQDVRRFRPGFECRAAEESFRERERIVAGAYYQAHDDYKRKLDGMMQRFIDVCGPRIDHDKAWRYYLELAGCADWSEQRDKYPDFADYTPEVWAAWLHKNAADGLIVRRDYYSKDKTGSSKYRPAVAA
jgi:hypothetical protein